MGLIFELYKLKVKLFFGAIRASKGGIILLLVYSFSMLPGAVGMSMSVIEALRKNVNLSMYINMLSAILSAFTVLVLLSVYRGFIAYEYEQNFVFTSPITPRQFLIASVLADLTVFLPFFYPLPLLFGIIAVSLTLPISSVLLITLSFSFFVFFIMLLKVSLSIFMSAYRDTWLRIIIALLMIGLLLPVVSLLFPFPLRYECLPYPSSLFARSLIDAVSSRPPSAYTMLGLALYFFLALLLFYCSSKQNVFQLASPIPLLTPLDTSMKMQTVKISRNIRFFSRIDLGITLNPHSKSLLRFLMKKELVRMVRDGSLFAVLIFYGILSVIVLITSTSESPIPLWLLVLGLYSFIVPSMLISNWRTVEIGNLWIPLTSGMRLDILVKSLLYDLTIIASLVPTVVIIILTIVARVNPLPPLVLIMSVSLIGCSTNLYTMIRFLGRKSKATPSFIISWFSILLSGLLISPAYAFVILSLLWNFNLILNLALSALILVYSALVFLYFSKLTYKKVISLEI